MMIDLWLQVGGSPPASTNPPPVGLPPPISKKSSNAQPHLLHPHLRRPRDPPPVAVQ